MGELRNAANFTILSQIILNDFSEMLKTLLFAILALTAHLSFAETQKSNWLLIDDFETPTLHGWSIADTQNDTNPHVPNPQVTEIRGNGQNQYLIKKPAQDGVVGNRKALTFKALPTAVPVGETYSFYARIQVETFPNNHAFGLSDLSPDGIKKLAYNAFEPTLRVTDKFESNGFKNDGTLMVKVDSDDKYRQYANIQDYANQRSAQPLKEGIWYQIWYVVNNATVNDGGQTYDVYVKGGEFEQQTLVYKGADFRMKRTQPLIYFVATTNTGSHKKPYGNGGLRYDDLYMSQGTNLTLPVTTPN